MNSKTYQAATMAEALAEVKQDLGRDAVILQTRSIRKGGVLGILGGKRMWEITAAAGDGFSPQTIKGQYVADEPAGQDESQALLNDSEDLSEQAAKAPIAVAATAEQQSPSLDSRVNQLHEMLQTLLNQNSKPRTSSWTAEMQELYEHLLEQDINKDIATDLMRTLQICLPGGQLTDRNLLRQRLVEVIAARIPVAVRAVEMSSRPAGTRVVALIGPTGVGKTTTIAKMAANLKLRQKKRVGLITIDTYRIAAVDQLRTYAEIIDVPLRAVLTAGELKQAVKAMGDLDVILVDTAGRSQNDELRLNQLRSLLAAGEADEIHLVLSAAANPRVAKAALEKFGGMNPNRIILTKLDEAATFGMILNVASVTRGALSYMTTGQDVPDDIAPADANKLARWIVGGSRDAS